MIKGKMGVSVAVFVLLGLIFVGTEYMFKVLVVYGNGKGLAERIGNRIVCFVLLSITLLSGLVAHTIVYFVCKSYHHENINKSSLSDHLGEYVPLKSSDVQLEHKHRN